MYSYVSSFFIVVKKFESQTFQDSVPDKLRLVVLKFSEQNAFDEMIIAPLKQRIYR